MTRSPGPRLGGGVVTEPDEQLSGAELRRLTTRVRLAHSGVSPGDVFVDLAGAAMSVVLAAGFLTGVAGWTRDLLHTAPGTLDPGLVQALGLAALTVAGLGLALRLGPAGVGAAGVRWWVPTTADRSGLVRPSVATALLAWTAGGAVGGGMFAGVVGASLGTVSATAALAGALGLVVVTTAGVLQVSGAVTARRRHAGSPSAGEPGPFRVPVRDRLTSTLDLVLAAIPVAGVVVLLAGSAGPPGGGHSAWAAPWWVPAALAAAGVWLTVLWTTRLERVGATELRARAAVADQVLGAVLSADSRGLGRALSASPRPGRGGRRLTSRLLGGVLGGVRGPRSALLTADLLLVLRSHRTCAGLVTLAALGVVAVQVPVLAGGLGLWAVLVGVGYGTAVAAAAGARGASDAPRVDALLPLGARWVRAVRVVVPAAASALAFGTTAAALDDPLWFPVLLGAAVVLGAAAVRTAYRRPPDWSAPLLATPMGAVPTGALRHSVDGPDLALLGTVPLLVAAVTSPSWTVAAVQLGVAALGVGLGGVRGVVRVPPGRGKRLVK